ncbi:MAG: hypothetical protein U0793_23920 [Gemmataceae bacterium]
MTYPRLRLAVATILFLGWIGFLAFLVVRTRDPVILSRPQFLKADAVVVVDLAEKNGVPATEVTLKETLWQAEGKEAIPTALRLAAVADIGPDQGWRGPGEYIVPLRLGSTGYEIPPIPWSPGFSPLTQLEIITLGADKNVVPWIIEHTRFSADEAKRASIKSPLVVRNLPYDAAYKMKQKLESLGADVNPLVFGEYRIYRATNDARAQVKAIKG